MSGWGGCVTDAPAASAANAIAGALIRHGITAAGTALVAHGYLDQQIVDSATDPLADYLLGAGLVAGSAIWSAGRASLMHSRWVQAWIAPARPLLTSPTAPADPASKEIIP